MLMEVSEIRKEADLIKNRWNLVGEFDSASEIREEGTCWIKPGDNEYTIVEAYPVSEYEGMDREMQYMVSEYKLDKNVLRRRLNDEPWNNDGFDFVDFLMKIRIGKDEGYEFTDNFWQYLLDEYRIHRP